MAANNSATIPAKAVMAGGFPRYGSVLLENGYLVLPIKQGEKRPALDNWQTARLGVGDIERYRNSGIGVLCGQGAHPIAAIDTDTTHAELAREYTEWCFDNLGVTCERVGFAPKVLLPYRAASAGWGKATGAWFEDENGGRHRLEILGKGQQFVAYHIHPDTGLPYEWIDFLGGIESVRASELPVITEDQVAEALKVFESMALKHGLVRAKGSSSRVGSVTSAPDDDDVLMNFAPPADGITLENALQYLEHCDVDNYDEWREVGMALHHQFDGSDEAMALWDRWSADGQEYKGIEDIEYRWASFGKSDGRKSITFRTLIDRYKERCRQAELQVKRDARDGVRQAIESCSDSLDLMSRVASIAGEAADGDSVLLSEFETLLRTKYTVLSNGARMAVAQVRAAMRGRQKRLPAAPGSALTWPNNCPSWARGWVYLAGENTYYHVEQRRTVDPAGFCGLYDSELPGDEEGSATKFVLNGRLIPKVQSTMYVPKVGALFEHNGVPFANTYSNRGAAVILDTLDANGEAAAALLKRHITLITGNGTWNREGQILANFLRWNIERPGEKIRWAVLLQGCEGDGKSLFNELMMLVLGPANVRTIRGSTIEASGSSSFNAWAEGHCFGFIEEIKLHGHNRFDVTNTLKPLITNDVVEIHPKGKDTRNVPNTANYFLTTNYKDAVPLDAKDRRYFVLFSRFPLGEIRAREGGYFENLIQAIRSQPGAVAHWLLSVPYHEDFKPNGHAPTTRDKEEAVLLTSDDLQELVKDVLVDSSNAAFGSEVVLFNSLLQFLQSGFAGDGVAIDDNRLTRILSALGFKKLGRYRLGELNEMLSLGVDRPTFWVRPTDGREVDADWARKVIEARAAELSAVGDLA